MAARNLEAAQARRTTNAAKDAIADLSGRAGHATRAEVLRLISESLMFAMATQQVATELIQFGKHFANLRDQDAAEAKTFAGRTPANKKVGRRIPSPVKQKSAMVPLREKKEWSKHVELALLATEAAMRSHNGYFNGGATKRLDKALIGVTASVPIVSTVKAIIQSAEDVHAGVNARDNKMKTAANFFMRELKYQDVLARAGWTCELLSDALKRYVEIQGAGGQPDLGTLKEAQIDYLKRVRHFASKSDLR